MSMRRSLPALDRVYQMFKNKVENLHQPKVKDIQNQLNELNNDRAKDIVAEIEAYAKERYPELRIPLKCESAHSSVKTNQISVGFWFDGVNSEDAEILKSEIKAEKDAQDADMKTLEKWKMDCMLAMAAGEGFPGVNIKGIEEVDSDPHYW